MYPSLAVPAVVVLAPRGIELGGGEREGEGGDIGIGGIAADRILISIVPLERGLQGEATEVVVLPSPLDLAEVVDDMVVGVADTAGEGAEDIGHPTAQELRHTLTAT